MSDPTTETLLNHIRALGFIVSVHKMSGTFVRMNSSCPTIHAGTEYIELHAIGLAEPNVQHIARVDDEGPEAEYRAACELARMVGMNLQDG